jgi:hypothetical protein
MAMLWVNKVAAEGIVVKGIFPQGNALWVS